MPHATACAPAFNACRARAGSAIPPAATTGSATAVLSSRSSVMQRRRPLHVSPRLDSLSDQAAGAGAGSSRSLFGIAHLHENESSGRTCPSDEPRVNSPRQGDDWNALREHYFEAFALIECEYKVHTERTGRGRPNRPDLRLAASRASSRRPRVFPSAPTADTAATSSTVVAGPIGACMIGHGPRKLGGVRHWTERTAASGYAPPVLPSTSRWWSSAPASWGSQPPGRSRRRAATCSS